MTTTRRKPPVKKNAAPLAKKRKPIPPVGLKDGRLVLPALIVNTACARASEYMRFDTKGEGPKAVGVLELNDLSVAFLKALLKVPELPALVRISLEKYVGRTPEELIEKVIEGPHEFYASLRFLSSAKNPRVELELNGTWYPIPLQVSFYKGWFGSVCNISSDLIVQDKTIERYWYVTDGNFRDSSGQPIKKKVGEVLKELGFRFSTQERVAAFREKLLRATVMNSKAGTVVDISTSVLVEVDVGWSHKLIPYALASEASPRQLIIENELEAEHGGEGGDREEKRYHLPFVRAFSTKLKTYCYIDVDSVKPHTYNAKARDLLVLPADLRRALNAVFDTKPEDVFGDLFDGRHGGVVILAAGGPGVGKTLTAETYAESMERPLYVMEMSELGTSLDQLERRVQKIFERARRWKAVLLLDEAEVLLAKRQEANLEQSAIVATFLRLLDYYEGTFFLTTNREDVIDGAFRSRITLRLSYPDLTSESRLKVWGQLLTKAKLTFSGPMEALVEVDLNGRNIRNAVRVIKMFNPGLETITMKEVHEALHFISRPTT